MKLHEVYKKVVLKTKQLNSQGKSGSRSSKRTDVLNQEFESWLSSNLTGNWTFKSEQKVKCSRGDKFTIDLVGYKDGEKRALFLFKAIQSSYNKNRHNYSNTLEGETSRIFDVEGVSNLDVFFIDWIPKEVPCYNKEGKLVKTEQPNPPDTSFSEKRWNQSLKSRNSSVSFLKLRFDYDFDADVVTDCGNNNDVQKKILEKLK